MKSFDATKVSNEEIELTNARALEELYTTISEEENFILRWKEGTVDKAEVIIANNLASKVKNGDVRLTAKEGVNKGVNPLGEE